MHQVPPLARRLESSEFAVTHCMRCAAGWTRTTSNGTKAVFCLLDREPVLINMVNCDRFELRED